MMKEREVRLLFKTHGYEVVDIRRRGHWQVKARRDGAVQHFTVPCSPSDWRARANLVADLNRGFRRWAGGVKCAG